MHRKEHNLFYFFAKKQQLIELLSCWFSSLQYGLSYL